MINYIKERGIELFLGAVIIFCIISIGYLIIHLYNYKCLRGHYETQYFYDYNIKNVIPQQIFICDCEILRDSIK